MNFGENKWLWVGISLLIIAAAVIVWLIASAEPPRLVILYDEIGDLKKGDPVVWKGFNIGKGEEIQPLIENRIGVTIRLREDYASKITRGSDFILKQAGLLGLMGSNAVEVITPATPGLPFSNGERIPGKITPRTSLLEEGKKWTLEYWKRLSDSANELLEQFKTSPYKKEAEEALAKLRTLSDEGAAKAAEGWQKFRRDHQKEFDSVFSELERIRDEMRKKGDQRGAERLDDEINKIRHNAEAEPKPDR